MVIVINKKLVINNFVQNFSILSFFYMVTALSEKLKKIIATVSVITIIFPLISPAAFADTNGPKNAGTAIDVSGVGTKTWWTTDNITSEGSPYSNVTLSFGETSHYIQAKNYGFSVPDGATINGVTVQVNRKWSANTLSLGVRDSTVKLIKAWSIIGNNKAATGTTWGTTFNTVTYGWSSDLWGTTLTPADINNGNFWVAFSVTTNAILDRTATIDSIKIIVNYTPDTVAPTLNLPSNITQEATSSAGNAITYTVTAVDTLPASPTVTCTPSSGSIFPVGLTTVNCSTTDTAGNITNGIFTVTVQDTTAPDITLHWSSVALTVGGSAYVEQGATVFDAVDTGLSAIIDSSSINQAIPGSYMVRYNATDTHGNAATTVNRVVNVSDVTGPVFSGVPDDIVVEQVGNSSAVVNYTTPTATDDVDGEVSVLCGPLSWALFSYGTTAVLCHAQDSVLDPGPNISNTSFNVTVQDTIAPTASNISITSSNSDSTLAKEWDTITLSFTTSESVNLVSATIAGKSATVTNVEGNYYTATYTLTAAETQGIATIAIDFEDVAGNDATQITATTDETSVTIDTIAPGNPVILTPTQLEVLQTPTTNVTWTCETGTTVSLNNPFIAVSPVNTLCISDSFSTDVTWLPTAINQDLTLVVTQTDLSGNLSAPWNHSLYYAERGENNTGGSGQGIIIINNVTPNTIPQSPIIPGSNTTPTDPTPPLTPPVENANNTPSVSAPLPDAIDDTNSTVNNPENTPGDTTNSDAIQNSPTNNGGTSGTSFDPRDTTLDIGGWVVPEETKVQDTPTTEIPQDIGGWVVPEENSHNLLWILLGTLALLNVGWYFVAKNKKEKEQMYRRD